VLSLNTITITSHGPQAEKLHVTPQITAPAASLFGVTPTVDLEHNHLSAKPGQIHVPSFSGFFSGSVNECHAYGWPSPGSADGDNTIIEAAPARPLLIFDDSLSTLNQKISPAMDTPASSQIALSLMREIHNCVGKNSDYDWKFQIYLVSDRHRIRVSATRSQFHVVIRGLRARHFRDPVRYIFMKCSGIVHPSAVWANTQRRDCPTI
jgi:hypothetical protein